MKKSLIPVLFVLLSMLSVTSLTSQVDLGADFVSRYLWRGQLLATGPAIQPSFSYTGGSFEIGAWGSYGLSNGFDGTEADIYISFSASSFTATITDYYFPSDRTGADFDNYFDYNESTTGHVLEAMLSYECESVPINFTVAYDFYGADTEDSFYAKIGYSLSDNTELFAEGGNGWYSFENSANDSFGFVGIGLTHTKEIKITESYSLPLFATVAINPDSEKLFIVFGMSF